MRPRPRVPLWVVLASLAWVALTTFGCPGSPTASRESCTAHNLSPLVGHWRELKTHRGHTYRLDLEITAIRDQPCSFLYRYVSHLAAHGDEPERQVYEDVGEMVAVAARSELGILVVELESRRLYRWALDAEGQPVESTEVHIHSSHEAKVWGSVLLLWGDQFERQD